MRWPSESVTPDSVAILVANGDLPARPYTKPGIGLPRGRAALAALTLVCLGAHPTMAAQGDVFTATAAVTAIWDDNLFRLPAAISVGPRSDYLVAPSAELTIDKPWSRQKLTLDATITAYRYGHYTQLDFVAPKYTARWRWTVTSHLKGILSASGDKMLSSFADFRSGTNGNVVTQRNEHASLDWWVGGGLHATASGFITTSDNSQRFVQVDTAHLHGGRIGLEYQSNGGSWIKASFSASHGDYPTRSLSEQVSGLLDRRFDRHTTKAELYWRLDPQVAIRASGGYVSQTYPDVALRNFSGGVGSMQLSWTPSRVLAIEIGADRQLDAWQDSIASDRVTDAAFLRPTWAISHTLSAQLALKRERVSYQGQRLPISPQGVPYRTDHISQAQLDLVWKATRRVTVTLSGQTSHRDSGPSVDYEIFRYSDHSVAIDANVSF